MQILINFLSNAIKFTADSPVKKISVDIDVTPTRPQLRDLYSSSSHAVSPEAEKTSYDDVEDLSRPSTSILDGAGKIFLLISVKDTGVGLSAKQQAVLFRRFAQATPKTQVSLTRRLLPFFNR